MLLCIGCIGHHLTLSISDVTTTLNYVLATKVCKKNEFEERIDKSLPRVTVCYHKDPGDRIVYPIHKLMIDSFNIAFSYILIIHIQVTLDFASKQSKIQFLIACLIYFAAIKTGPGYSLDIT